MKALSQYTEKELEKIFHSTDTVRLKNVAELEDVQPDEMIIVRRSYLWGPTHQSKEQYFVATTVEQVRENLYLQIPTQLDRDTSKWRFFVAKAKRQ